MKNFIVSPRFMTYVLFIGLFFLGCKDLKTLDPGKDLKLIMNYKPADSFVEAQVKDAKTGQLILDKINIEIIGTQSANVINFEGEAKTTYTKKGPSIYLGLRNVTPSDKNPITFKIIVSADGYLSSSRDVALTGVSNAPVEILLVKTSALPTGAAIQQSTLSSAAGTGTSQDKVIEVQNGQNSTIVEIDKGTILKDSKGNVLTGSLQTAVTTFSGQSKEAAKAFPAGNFVTLDKGQNGTANTKATLLPIAFASVELKDANGSRVANFSQPVDISFEISPTKINPKTNKAYKVGDKISILSYSETSGNWTYEKEGIIIQKGSEYFVTFPTNHLSWYAVSNAWGDSFENDNSAPVEAFQTINLIIALRFIDFQKPIEPINNANIIFDYYKVEYEVYFPDEILYVSTYLLGIGDGIFSRGFANLPTIAEKLVIKINLDGEMKVLEIKDLKSKNNTFYWIDATRKNSKLKTIYPTVTCENNCPVEIKPYNIGIEGSSGTGLGLAGGNWMYLGAVNYDASDGKIKLMTYLPDNENWTFRASSYPEYTKEINTGSTGSFTVPILLSKDHPLCKCGK